MKNYALRLVIFLILIFSTVIAFIFDNLSTEIVFYNIFGPRKSILDFLNSQMFYFITKYFPHFLIRGILIFWIATPFISAVNKLKSGKNISNQMFQKARQRLVNMSPILVGTSILGYLVENAIILILNENYINMTVISLSIFIFKYSLFGYIFGQLEVNFMKIALSKERELLEVYNIEKNDRKELSIKVKNLSLGVGVVLYVVVLFSSSITLYLEHEHVYYENALNYVSGSITLEEAKGKYYNYLKKIIQIDNFELPHFPRIENIDFFNKFYVITFTIMLMALMITILTQFFFSKDLSLQIGIIRARIEELSSGKSNLAKRISIIHTDEIGYLVDSFNRFVENLNSILIKVSQSSKEVGNSSGILSNSVDEASDFSEQLVILGRSMADSNYNQLEVIQESQNVLNDILRSIDRVGQNVDVQSSFVEETSTSINQMVSNLNTISESTLRANNLMYELVRIAKRGGQAVKNSMEAIREIENSSTQVEEIVALISQIAEQTNLLAMNAAIEAAHAGDAGKGFAVVADEIRKLAENSSNRASEIISHISLMTNQINNGVKLAEEAGSAFQVISKDIDETSQVMIEINSAMQEQNKGANSVLSSVNGVVGVTRKIKDLSKEKKEKSQMVASAMKNIILASDEMKESVEKQAKANSQIMEMLNKVIDISRQNKLIVNSLQDTLKGFELTNNSFVEKSS